MRDQYIGPRDTLGMPRWRQDIPHRTSREQLEEQSITGRGQFGKRSSSLLQALEATYGLFAFPWENDGASAR